MNGLACSQELRLSPHLYPTPPSCSFAAIQHVPPAGGLAAVAQAGLEQDRGGAHHPENPPGSEEITFAKWRSRPELCGSLASAGPGVDRTRASSETGMWGWRPQFTGGELRRALSHSLGTSGGLSLLFYEEWALMLGEPPSLTSTHAPLGPGSRLGLQIGAGSSEIQAQF